MSKKFSRSVQNLRTIAIIGIVFHHSAWGYDEKTQISYEYLYYNQLFNYGTLLFMLISGYFFQKSIKKYSKSRLLINKVRTVLIPYLLLIMPLLLTKLFISPYIGEKIEVVDSRYIKDLFYQTFFVSSYWFVVNLLIIQVINTYLTNIRKLKWLAGVMGVITLLYSINIYSNWVNSSHTTAIFGYLFFFFLGRLIFQYKNFFQKQYERISNAPFFRFAYLVLFAFFYFISIQESFFIFKINPKTDMTNILRVTNIFFAFTLFISFYGKRNRVKFSNSFTNKTVFLIYLIHPYFIVLGSLLFGNIFGYGFPNYTFVNGIYNAVYGLVVLYLSLVAAKLIVSNALLDKLIFNSFRLKEKAKPIKSLENA